MDGARSSRDPADSPALSRRRLLAAGLAGGAGIAGFAGSGSLLGACARSTLRAARSVPPAGSDLGAVEHVVIVIQENRSFDHYFGSYRGVRGFDDHPSGRPGSFAQRWPGGPAGSGDRLLPFHLDTATTDAECIDDLSHAWSAQHLCWNGGAMDAFVSTHTSSAFDGGDTGRLTMGYYTRSDLPYYYALADSFTICDGYHCSVFGPTHPNRLFLLSGTNDPDGHAGGPVLTTNESESAKFSASWPTMPEALGARRVSWKVYNPTGSVYLPSSSLAMAVSNNILLYFRQFSDPTTDSYRNAFGYTVESDFPRDVATGSLPAVSWILAPNGYDEHPPAPPSRGEHFVDTILSALTSDPAVWSKTVLFVTYDENDGFFDHVRPPTPPPGTPGEYVTVEPLPAIASGISGPVGLGFRVPMLVVSPFSRGGYVCSDTFDHTSILRFLETRFGARVPNVSPWRRRTVGDLTTTLAGAGSSAGASAGGVASSPRLPPTSDEESRTARECVPAQLVELPAPMAPYPITFPQAMPVQEPGRARRLRV